MNLSKKLKLPVLFIAVCFFAVLLGSAVARHAKHESVAKVTQVEQTQVPDGPYNDVAIYPHQKLSPKPVIEQPLP